MIEKIKEGQYFYGRHRRLWGVWMKENGCGSFVRDFPTMEEARKAVYELNGWFNKQQ